MDGNGRWATQRGLPRTAGHKAGAETFRRIATYCKNIGVKYLTVYAFSTENWKRSETEVAAIMALLKRYLLEAVDTMEKDHIRLHFFGDMTPIAPDLRALARETDEITEHLSKDDFQANGPPGGSPPTAPPGRNSRRTWTTPCSPPTWTPPASRTRSSSSAPAGSCGSPTSSCGSAPTVSSTSPMCCGRTSTRRSWTGPSRPITTGTGGSAV